MQMTTIAAPWQKVYSRSRIISDFGTNISIELCKHLDFKKIFNNVFKSRFFC